MLPSIVLCVIRCGVICVIRTWNKRQLKLIPDYFNLPTMATSLPTGYGPRLHFDGDQDKYELWELNFLGHMRLQKIP